MTRNCLSCSVFQCPVCPCEQEPLPQVCRQSCADTQSRAGFGRCIGYNWKWNSMQHYVYDTPMYCMCYLYFNSMPSTEQLEESTGIAPWKTCATQASESVCSNWQNFHGEIGGHAYYSPHTEFHNDCYKVVLPSPPPPAPPPAPRR